MDGFCFLEGSPPSSRKRGPLRTVRASFPAYGSNLQTKFCLRQNRLSYYKFTNVYLLVTVRVKQDPVGQLV